MNSVLRYYFAFLLCICGIGLRAQDMLNSAVVDQKTYDLFNQKQWKEVLRYGNKALKKGYDYYYLRMRMGIALYEKKNYCRAQEHFKAALKFNSNDTLAQEYLYYSYLLVGRNDEARKLGAGFRKDLLKRIGLDPEKALGFLFVEGGSKITDSISYYDKSRHTSSNFYNPAAYFQCGLSHYIKNKVSLFHAFTYYSQTNFLGDLRQIQYYIKPNFVLKKNWSLAPSFHWVNIRVSSELPSPPTPPGGGKRQPPRRTVTASNYMVASLAVQKVVGKWNVSLGSTFSNIYNKTQYIHFAQLACYVFGNSKLVLGANGYMHTSDSYSTLNYAYVPFIYVQPVRYVSLKVSYFKNQQNNIVEENGYLVNNSADLTNNRLSFALSFYLGKHISLYGVYQREDKTESVQKFDYKYNVFMGGLKYTP